jgi:simple sugar transport system ATP-binding protein
MWGVSLLSPTGNTLLDDVSLDVRPGEIVAVAGVQGNGQTELAEVLLGLETPNEGKILLDGKDLTRANVRQHLKADIGFVPEDRSTDGMIGSFSIAENLITDQYHDKQFARGPFMKPRAIAENAEKRVEEFDIRVGSVTDAISTLSGGNQQKVVVARELSQDLRLLVANQPTRGVDVGSIEFIHQRIVAARDEGVPVLVVSSELDEVYALADRIAVMYRGRIVAVVPPDTPRDVMGLLMAGVPEEEAMATGAKEGTK